MLGTPFNHDIIRKCVIAFGTLFNNIKIRRSDDTLISIPITYSSKEKWYARLTDPDLAQQIMTSLPRISYDMVALNYAAERKLGTMSKYSSININDETGNTKLMMYEGVPYNLNFEMAIYGRNAADCSKIIEQILPFFTPEFTLTLNNVTEHEIDVDIPIVLDTITRDDAYEGDFESGRTLIWTLNFTMKTMLFGPVTPKGIIKKAYVDFFIPNSFIRFHSGTLAQASLNTNQLYLQANTASRLDDIYAQSGFITITGEGTGTTGITGNTRNIISYDGDKQLIEVSPPFLDTPDANWTYRIQYRGTRSQGIDPDQLEAIPTASRIYIQPGLTLAGDPTSDIALSVPLSSIDVDDDWGYAANNTLPTEGTRRNLITGVDEDL
jgi:hypothetical protein